MNSSPTPESQAGSRYVVVARRYRPKSFGQLIGQDQVSKALLNAVNTGRVGHAYLFTGARGVGKTSSARIFAKALNCPQATEAGAPSDCQCDICAGIDVGDDIDVLEIDGASNRGIDEIRQLRANVNIRPSRARNKIYIIDEVHMLTPQAFNALLKTLEEPPSHVKFIFCTTDPEKIPITVLSRCQRFDFAPIASDSILQRLREIVTSEGRTAEDAALELLARRAGGSMRDSQSLLEQLLSFAGEEITEADVHTMLGTAPGGRVKELSLALMARDGAQSLTFLDEAVSEGVEITQMADQLLGYLRDVMAASVGCPAELLIHSPGTTVEELCQQASEWNLEVVLAAAQVMDQAIVRMRHSVHPRTLLEIAIIRIVQLDQLGDIAELIARLDSGSPPSGSPSSAAPSSAAPASAATSSAAPASPGKRSTGAAGSATASEPPTNAAQTKSPQTKSPQTKAPAPLKGAPQTERGSSTGASAPSLVPTEQNQKNQKKTTDPTPQPDVPRESEPDFEGGARIFTNEDAGNLWTQILSVIEDMTAEFASRASGVAISAPNRIVVTFPPGYTLHKDNCERPERRSKIEQAAKQLAGGRVGFEFRVDPAHNSSKPARQPRQSAAERMQAMREMERNPLIRAVMEMFEAEILALSPPRPPNAKA